MAVTKLLSFESYKVILVTHYKDMPTSLANERICLPILFSVRFS